MALSKRLLKARSKRSNRYTRNPVSCTVSVADLSKVLKMPVTRTQPLVLYGDVARGDLTGVFGRVDRTTIIRALTAEAVVNLDGNRRLNPEVIQQLSSVITNEDLNEIQDSLNTHDVTIPSHLTTPEEIDQFIMRDGKSPPETYRSAVDLNVEDLYPNIRSKE